MRDRFECPPSGAVVSLTSHTIAVSGERGDVTTWDGGGRLYAVSREDVTWRRGWSGAVLESRATSTGHVRRVLSDADAVPVIDGAAERAAAALAGFRACSSRPAQHAEAGRVEAWLSVCAQFDGAAAARDGAAYRAMAGHVGILPPDQYLAVALRATDGCSYNGCAFCGLYDHPHRVSHPERFREHVAAMVHFLGGSLALRAGRVFLGAGNALAAPTAIVRQWLQIVADTAPLAGAAVSGFIDAAGGLDRTPGEWEDLRHLGLRRIHVGLESGHDPLLALMGKPTGTAALVDLIGVVRSTGIGVAVIVIAGLGGERFHDRHTHDTIAVLRQMALGPQDIVYISPLVIDATTRYGAIASRHGFGTLPADAEIRQYDTIARALRATPEGPRVTKYDLRTFVA